MRKLLEQIQRDLRGFIEQRDDLVLFTACSDNDTPMALKILRDIEQSTDGDMFLMFADEFEEAGSYVETVMERLRAEHCLADEQLVEEGDEALPPMPEPLLDEERPPQQRLMEAVMWARSLLPKDGGHLLIFVLCPTRIADRAAFLQLVNIFVPWQLQPWMRRGFRFIFRDLPVGETVGAEISAPRTRVLPLDLGPEALNDSLTDEALDTSLPLNQRLQSLLMLAVMDMGHGRVADALTKYEILLGHYQQQGDARMQALVHNNIGDVYHHRQEDKLDEAQRWYECAVPLASEAKDPVLLLTVISNLGDVVYKKQMFPMAEELYRSADELAAKLGNPEARVLSLERLGLSQEHQQKFPEAMISWEAAVKLCKIVGEMDPYQQTNQAHIERVKARARQAPRATGPYQPAPLNQTGPHPMVQGGPPGMQAGVTGPHPVVPGVPQQPPGASVTGPHRVVTGPGQQPPGANVTGPHRVVTGPGQHPPGANVTGPHRVVPGPGDHEES